MQMSVNASHQILRDTNCTKSITYILIRIAFYVFFLTRNILNTLQICTLSMCVYIVGMHFRKSCSQLKFYTSYAITFE